MIKIAPSILSADFGRLAREVADVTAAGADWIHVDVMDGQFVPNITIGPPVVKAVRKATDLPLDTHLMIKNPDDFLEVFAEAGVDFLSVHVEVLPHLHRTIQRIKELGMLPGAALNPSTPLNTIKHVLEELDYVLIMSVNPGFGNQYFIPDSLNKIRSLRKMIDESGLDILIEVDGGIKTDNIAEATQAGVDVFVSGSGVFGTSDYKETLRLMKANAQK
ncbi:MAG: ribulose-phosphate 3-epimerase [Candidatus Adiutricales bacterium]